MFIKDKKLFYEECGCGKMRWYRKKNTQ